MPTDDPVTRPLHRPMRARIPGEDRGQTSLELLFDLAFSAAAGFAAVELTGTLHRGGWGEALVAFAMVFFAIWWGWLNVSWFMSAYDTDDGLTWALTTVQILGASAVAAGVPTALADRDFTVVTVGYAVMRLPLAAQWARAAAGDPARRTTCLQHMTGLLVLQAGWLGRLALPGPWSLPTFVLLAAAEVALPALAQRRQRIPTNPGHMAGRYGRFTLAVAAQIVAAAIVAVRASAAGTTARPALMAVAAVSVGLVVSLLWLYHSLPHRRVAGGRYAGLWEHGHYAIVGGIGAMGAGARYLAERIQERGEVTAGTDDPQRWAAYPLVTATAIAIAAIWLVCVLPGRDRGQKGAGRFAGCLAVVLAAPLALPRPVAAAGAAAAALLVLAVLEGLAARAGVPPPAGEGRAPGP